MRGRLQGKTRVRYVVSYLLVSILPIWACSGLLLYFNFTSNCQTITLDGYHALSLARSNVDLMIKNMESCGNHFSSNQRLIEAYDASRYNLISQQLGSYQSNYPYFSHIAFYLKGYSEIFDTEDIKSYKQFQQELAPRIDLDLTAFFTQMLKEQGYSLRDSFLGVDQSGEYLIYTHAVPLLDATPLGTLAFFVDKQVVQSLFEKSMGDMPCTYWILKDTLQPLYVSDDSGQGDQRYAQLGRIKGTGTFLHEVEGEPYIFYRLFSENTALHYWAAIPRDVLLASAYKTLRQQCVGMGVLLLVVGLLACIVGLGNYIPIKRLAEDILADGIPQDWMKDQDLFAHLRSQYQRISMLNNDLASRIQDQQSLLQRQNAALRHQVLEQLVQGTFRSPEDIRLRMEEVGITWPMDGFLALVARMEDYDEENSPLDILEAFHFKDGIGYPLILQQEQMVALLVNLPWCKDEAPMDRKNRQMAIGWRFHELLIQRQLVPRGIGVGSIYPMLTDMSMTLVEAHTALHGAQADSSIQAYAPSDQGDLFQAFLPVADKALLCQSVMGGHLDIARAIFRKMLCDIQQVAQSPLLERSWCIFVCDAMVGVMVEQNLPVDTRVLSRLAGFCTLDDFAVQIERAIEVACETIHERMRQREQSEHHAILHYLRENFCAYDLSLKDMSGRFSLSENYISRLIKKQTGYTFAQYLNLLRLEHVKEQLVETDRAIKDIVNEAGYKDWLAEAIPGAETLWTLADWEIYLQWILDNQPDVIAPFGLTSSGYDQLMAPAFGFLTGWYQVEGKVMNGFWQEGLRDYLELYHDWYERGFISKDFTTLSNQKLFESGLAGSYNGASNTALARCIDLGIEIQNTPYPRQYEGQWINGFYMLWPNNSMTANISTSCKNVELAMEFMDYGYTMRGSQTYNYGMEGKSWVAAINDDYTSPQYTDYMLNHEKYTIDEVNNILRMHQTFPRYRVGDRFSLPYNIKSPEILAYHLQWVDDPNYGVEFSLPPLTLSIEANARRSEIWSNVNTYASEMVLKFIVGAEPLENFDQYMETIRSMGIEEAIAITQEAYDAHMSK